MKAIVKYAPGEGKVNVLDVEEPSCGDDQVKLERQQRQRKGDYGPLPLKVSVEGSTGGE